MSYSVPALSVPVVLGDGYSPPALSVPVVLGAPVSNDRTLTISGETLPPTGLILGGVLIQAALAGETLAPTGVLTVAYDPNLLSAVHAVTAAGWQPGAPGRQGAPERWQPAPRWARPGLDRWQPAPVTPARALDAWQPAAALSGAGLNAWQPAASCPQAQSSRWEMAPRLGADGADRWQAAGFRAAAIAVDWRDLPRIVISAVTGWQAAGRVLGAVRDEANDGTRRLAVEIEIWQTAGYPANAVNPEKDAIPTPLPAPWGTVLKLRCALPGAALHLGRVPCVLIAARELAVRRTYMSVNTASLVRWPDLAPLPCTSIALETDFGSWCWSLTATLESKDAWPLVQPNPLACEVLATINGQQWKCLLDVPSTQQRFNSDRVTLKGRSRSAWLHAPYTRAQDFSEANAREMQQLAEAALDNTGWTLNWQGENWLVPAGRYYRFDTPIGALIHLARVTDDGLYTDPALQVITLQKRWPAPSWLLDGTAADLLIPEDAVAMLTQSPVYTPPYNGVYVSGVDTGVLGFVKIAGTDGALQPDAPLVDDLLCDSAGVAARQRGVNALSDSGPGYILDAETLFTPEIGLVKPGSVVSIAGMKGVSRSVKVTAQWSRNVLEVKQTIGLERREVV